uniref:Uncharacterized protein n=1 Tax=Oryza glumipatula TaxID=40148 RepID=A0A0D9Y6B0_9ORYZ
MGFRKFNAREANGSRSYYCNLIIKDWTYTCSIAAHRSIDCSDKIDERDTNTTYVTRSIARGDGGHPSTGSGRGDGRAAAVEASAEGCPWWRQARRVAADCKAAHGRAAVARCKTALDRVAAGRKRPASKNCR